MEQGRDVPDHEATSPQRYTYVVEPRPLSLGEALKRDRDALGLKQTDVAPPLGFHQTKLSAYEKGKIKRPPVDRLIGLARRYGRPDNYYTDMAGMPSADKRYRAYEETVASGALIIPQPREGLSDLIETLARLDQIRFQRVVELANHELTLQRDRAAQNELRPATARDTA